MKISILGYGSFGEALASRLEINKHSILKEEIHEDTDLIFVSVPSYAVVEVLLNFIEKIGDKNIIICSKGLNKDGSLFSSVLSEKFKKDQIYFLYGPTLASELKQGIFSVMILAGFGEKEELKKSIESENLKIILSSDVIGLQVASALKNIVGIFLGIIEGAGFGQNTEGYVFSKGLEEIQKFGISLGASPDTFISIVGAGDLFVKSRNRIIGIRIGKGEKIEDILKDISYPKEGLNSLEALLKQENNMKLDLSFFKILNDVIYNNLPVREALEKIINIK